MTVRKKAGIMRKMAARECEKEEEKAVKIIGFSVLVQGFDSPRGYWPQVLDFTGLAAFV